MNPKAKSGLHERDTCRRLSQWVTGLKRRDIFWRSAMSGGVATLANRKAIGANQTQLGDIGAIHPLGNALLSKFVIECKHHADFMLDMYFFTAAGSGKVNDFWIKLRNECGQAGRRSPFLILRQNNREELVATDSPGLAILRLAGPLSPRIHVPKPLDMLFVAFRDVLMTDFDKIRAFLE